jgi:hypothetical protein
VTAVRVSVDVPPELRKLSSEITRRSGRLYDAAAKGMAAEVARRAPGGAGGRVGRSFFSRGGDVIPAHPGARALDRGAYITPKGLRGLSGRDLRLQRRRLRFKVDGKTVFAPSVRIPARHYIRQALRKRRSIIDRAFEQVFGGIT